MTPWLYRVNVIIPIALKTVINALWTIIAPEGDPEAESFGLPLSLSGQNPASHLAISTAATEEMVTLITQIFTDDLVGCHISIQDYTVNDWDVFLAANGLQVIQTELEI